MLVNDGGKKVLVARATGDGFEAPVATDAPASARRLVVGDFNGDLLTDAGLLSTVTPGTANLAVMFRQAGGWSAPADRWTGALDLDAADAFVAAGDVNGDGKADLVMRDGADGYRVAPSFASCASFGNWGPCLNVPGTGLAAATPWLASPSWALADARHTLTDFDRDGRTDVLFTTTRAGGGVRVMVLRATAERRVCRRCPALGVGECSFRRRDADGHACRSGWAGRRGHASEGWREHELEVVLAALRREGCSGQRP